MRQYLSPTAKWKRRQDRKLVRKSWRVRAVRKLGGECVHCGNPDIRVLQIDHVNGDGLGITSGYEKIKEWKTIVRGTAPDGKFQVLCANCHVIKTRESDGYIPSAYREQEQPDLFPASESMSRS